MSPLDVPEDGDYIIGRVIEVKDFGATLDLLEYTDQKAFVHISEVASGWVKYIRDFIREGQMVVAKVTKVKKGSKIIDASVRQVSGHRKKEKIREWKNEQRASKLLELVAKNIKVDYEKLRNEVREDLVNNYESDENEWAHLRVQGPSEPPVSVPLFSAGSAYPRSSATRIRRKLHGGIRSRPPIRVASRSCLWPARHFRKRCWDTARNFQKRHYICMLQ